MIRALFILLCLALGAAGAFYAQPYMHGNADAVLIIVTVFTVFAGFLIAIITIVGDPIMIPEGSWRIAEGGRDRMERRLLWHIVLFVLYLVTIGILFVGAILDKAITGHHEPLKIWVERAYLFVGISSFFFTFALPAALLEMQRARYDAETDRRRRAVGIQSDDPQRHS
jgi:hypothetical protein